jgi:hypothetical protein
MGTMINKPSQACATVNFEPGTISGDDNVAYRRTGSIIIQLNNNAAARVGHKV